jgi:perosamine synthetase
MSRYAVPYSPRGTIYGEVELEELRRLLLDNRLSLSSGEERVCFEEEFQRLSGASYAVSVSSCTVGLELAAYIANLEPGCAVIVTPQTYQATLNPLLGLPIEVRFCDIECNSLCLDPNKLSDLICPKVRAIFVTHYGGLCAEMGPIMSLAEKHNICVIEDCAHALGSKYRGRWPGTFGDIGVFSFQSMKNISTLGQGGMMLVKRADWAERLRRLRDVEPDAEFAPCKAPPDFARKGIPERDLNRHAKNAYTHDCLRILRAGTNSTLSEPAAAIGRVQLKRLDSLVSRRRAVAACLEAGLCDLPGVRLQREPHDQYHSHHLYTFFVDPAAGLNRDAIATKIDDAGVEIHLRYFPLHLLPEWRCAATTYKSCPVAEEVWFNQQINLPIYPSLTDQQVDTMINAVRMAILTSVATNSCAYSS